MGEGLDLTRAEAPSSLRRRRPFASRAPAFDVSSGALSAQAAPDAELLAVRQGVFEAVLTHNAAAADLLGLPGGGASLREEEVWVDTHAVRLVLPCLARHLQNHLCELSHRCSPQSR